MNLIAIALSLFLLWPGVVLVSYGEDVDRQAPRLDVLSVNQWKNIDDAVDRGLAWLALQQREDGSFPTMESGQPAVTSLAVMAFLSRGHVPGIGPYGKRLDRAIDFVVAQQQDEGLLYGASTDMPMINNWNQGPHVANYNHAIAGLMLGEVFGMTDGQREKKLRPVIDKAIAFARKMQRRPSLKPLDRYGWRYYKYINVPNKGDADLSVTGWFIMFYRSALNAGFNIPQEYVDDAAMFVRACYVEEEGAFVYGPYPRDHQISRGTAGAGLLCLTLMGKRDVRMERAAGRWLLNHPFTEYNRFSQKRDRYHYGAYYASQAMFMVGGEEWAQFYPPLAKTLIANQDAAGSWQPESAENDAMFGNSYTTSLSILALTPPYQLLPIYQR
jgi:hypothetical protein